MSKLFVIVALVLGGLAICTPEADAGFRSSAFNRGFRQGVRQGVRAANKANAGRQLPRRAPQRAPLRRGHAPDVTIIQFGR